MAFSWPYHLGKKCPYFGRKPVSRYAGQAVRHFGTPRDFQKLGSNLPGHAHAYSNLMILNKYIIICYRKVRNSGFGLEKWFFGNLEIVSNQVRKVVNGIFLQ
jgi:hypothetical protein